MTLALVLADIRGIRGEVEIPDPYLWIKVLGWTLAVVGIGAAAVLIFLRRTGRPAGVVDPYTEAIDSLAGLRRYLSEDEASVYTIGVSDAVRRYLSRRFGIASGRKTTEEFFEALAGDEVALSAMGSDRGHLEGFLQQCDLIKFAGLEPSVRELEGLHSAARAFVEATRPQGGSREQTGGGGDA